MPRYYFHTQTTTRRTDETGFELASPIEARRQAIQTSGEMLRDSPEGFWGSRPWSVSVTDDQGLILWELFMDGFASAAAPV
jgi:hypothetical protein